MIQRHYYRWLRTHCLTVATVLGCWLAGTAIARADYNSSSPSQPTSSTGSTGGRGYIPSPTSTRPRKPTGSKGTRGGCEASQLSTVGLIPLAPQQHLGRTQTTHPTFVWYLPGTQSYPIELTLFEEGANGRGKRLQTFTIPGTPGLMQWTLPADQPGLTVGQPYVWQIALICNPNHPSQNPWIEAGIEVAAPPPDLKATLATTTDPLRRAEAYAAAGFWYDALATTFEVPTGRSLRHTLLTQLSQLEAPEQQAQLKAIIAHDRP